MVNNITSIYIASFYLNGGGDDFTEGGFLEKELKYHNFDLTYGEVWQRLIDGKRRLEAHEEMVSDFLKSELLYEIPKQFNKGGSFSWKRFVKVMNSVTKDSDIL